jgi:hypothetical protein
MTDQELVLKALNDIALIKATYFEADAMGDAAGAGPDHLGHRMRRPFRLRKMAVMPLLAHLPANDRGSISEPSYYDPVNSR